MSEKTNLHVFSKKEVVLIFLFMLVIASTSFVIGIKVGKEHAYTQANITLEDVQTVDSLESAAEEDATRILEAQKKSDESVESMDAVHDKLKKKISEQIGEAMSEDGPTREAEGPGHHEAATAANTSAPTETEPQEDKIVGKYTIQLGSYRSIDDAKQFAEGFRIRGYNPIINEVSITGKGIWYRVSLGLFDNSTEARSYIKKEKHLFGGEDHFIVRLE